MKVGRISGASWMFVLGYVLITGALQKILVEHVAVFVVGLSDHTINKLLIPGLVISLVVIIASLGVRCFSGGFPTYSTFKFSDCRDFSVAPVDMK